MDESHVVSEDDLLTMDDAAARLGMTKRSLQRLIASGRFPRPIKLTPKITRVLHADVVDYIRRAALLFFSRITRKRPELHEKPLGVG